MPAPLTFRAHQGVGLGDGGLRHALTHKHFDQLPFGARVVDRRVVGAFVKLINLGAVLRNRGARRAEGLVERAADVAPCLTHTAINGLTSHPTARAAALHRGIQYTPGARAGVGQHGIRACGANAIFASLGQRVVGLHRAAQDVGRRPTQPEFLREAFGRPIARNVGEACPNCRGNSADCCAGPDRRQRVGSAVGHATLSGAEPIRAAFQRANGSASNRPRAQQGGETRSGRGGGAKGRG